MGKTRSSFGRGGLLFVASLTLCCWTWVGEAHWASMNRKSDRVTTTANSFQQECKYREDCPLNYCCTVGMMRYSLPTCTRFGKRGDACIPDNEQRNFSLSFPNMDERLEVIDSYSMFCPCSDEFYCDRGSVSCEPFDIHNNILSKNKQD